MVKKVKKVKNFEVAVGERIDRRKFKQTFLKKGTSIAERLLEIISICF